MLLYGVASALTFQAIKADLRLKKTDYSHLILIFLSLPYMYPSCHCPFKPCAAIPPFPTPPTARNFLPALLSLSTKPNPTTRSHPTTFDYLLPSPQHHLPPTSPPYSALSPILFTALDSPSIIHPTPSFRPSPVLTSAFSTHQSPNHHPI